MRQFLNCTLSTLAGITAFAVLPALPGHAQGIGVFAGPTLGISRTVLDGQIKTSAVYQTGFSGGIMLRIRPSERFAIQPELRYTQQGAGNGNEGSATQSNYAIRLHYLTLPIMAKIYIGKVVNVQFGPQFGLLMAAWKVGTTYKGAISYPTNASSDDFAAADVALCGGLGVDLPNGLVASARLNYGVTDINANADEAKFREALNFGGLHNRGFEFSLGYLFGANKK